MADTMPNGPTLRHDQANAVRERILAATVEVIEAGEEPTMRSVAQAAGVSERTMYRYYPSRDDLFAAVAHVLRERASAPMADDAAGLPDYARRLFTTFHRNPRLARALSTAAWLPTHLTRPANLEALRKVIDAGFPGAPKADRESAAAALRVLLSAAGWAYLADCGFNLKASVRHAQWVADAVLDKLRQHEGVSDA
jgi:AcrR family transcriptional regulator